MNSLKEEKTNKKNSLVKELISLSKILIISLILIIPLKLFIIEPFIVDGISMSPSLESGNYLIVNKMTNPEKVQRGNILVFVPPDQRSNDWKKYTTYFDPRKKYIKRVVGLPNETIKIENKDVYIKKAGSDKFIKLTEPFIKSRALSIDQEITLREDQFFMLGDNRGNSYDSEEWGPISASDIEGEPILRLYPFTKISTYPERYKFKN